MFHILLYDPAGCLEIVTGRRCGGDQNRRDEQRRARGEYHPLETRRANKSLSSRPLFFFFVTCIVSARADAGESLNQAIRAEDQTKKTNPTDESPNDRIVRNIGSANYCVPKTEETRHTHNLCFMLPC